MVKQAVERRQVVSFVRRSTRMNPSQRAAMQNLGSTYLVQVPRGELSTSLAPGTGIDWGVEFGRAVGPGGAPLIVEIGSGTGDGLVQAAETYPDARLIAFEVYQPAVASTMIKLAAHGTTNVRLVVADGVQGLRQLIAPATLAQLHTYFPDPWHKLRHHKRRLVSPDFAELVISRLAPGGRWQLATDWTDYAEQMRQVLDARPELVNEFADAPGGWAPRPADRPITRYEARGLDAGRIVRELRYRRLP